MGRHDAQQDIQQRALAIVGELLDRPPSERDAALVVICDGDAELESDVRSLLAASDGVSTSHPLADVQIDRVRADAEGGFEESRTGPKAIGTFRVLCELGRGGMSVVYECEQDNPRRRVAVKLMDSRLTGPAMNRRLRLEAEILGRLRHECIATVHEAGVTPKSEGGRPYFAMELVEGVPLTEFAERESLNTRQRLALLARVADGVEHAHQKGVIHRDLKPGNILVTPAGVPKILDFGIARVTHADVNTSTMHTSVGAILGTIAYMSPEQASADEASLGTPTDVYSLGAMGYELLTGKLPLPLEDRPIYDAIRMIRDETPTMLSSRATHWRGDIETVIHKALEKEPERRYPSAGAFADDLRRHLSDQPITARPPSTWYQLQKFSKRNRALVGGVVATLVVLVLGVVASSLLAVAERDARLTAQQQGQLAQQREIVAISGVLSASQALAQANQGWEARRQLSLIDPQSRGWEWRHTALALPWVIDIENRRQVRDGADGKRLSAFSGPRELILESKDDEPGASIIDLVSEQLSTIPVETEIRRVAVSNRKPGRAAVVTRDGRIGDVDTRSGTLTEWMPGTDFELRADHVGMTYASPSESIVVVHEGRFLRIFHDGVEVFREETRAGPRSSMTWRRPEFDPDERYVYLSECASLGYIRAIETGGWTQVAEFQAELGTPRALLSHDGSRLFVRNGPNRIDVLSTPSLERVGTISPDIGTMNVEAIAPVSDLLILGTMNPGAVTVYDDTTKTPLHTIRLDADGLNAPPFVSPDGRLAATPLPDEEGIWILDLTLPENGQTTSLAGHGSWVYQLAVSPDGSLLASAEPQGDILLWDLRADRLLARLPRRTGSSDALLVHNMNAPLAFVDDGNALVFGELDGNFAHGLTTLNLTSGERTWTETGSREATLDTVAELLPAGEPATLYHHAALLANGKIVQTSTNPGRSRLVVVRDPQDPEATVMLEDGTYTYAGVAAHPTKSEYASGEYRMIRVRDADSNEVLHEISDGTDSRIYGIAYLPDGSRLAIATQDGRVLILETNFYERIAQFRIPPKPDPSDRNYIFNLVWTPDGTRLITTGTNRLFIFESERPFAREHKRAMWTQDLDRARQGSDASEAARRVAAIERWTTRDAPDAVDSNVSQGTAASDQDDS